jgi:hypothetical protein
VRRVYEQQCQKIVKNRGIQPVELHYDGDHHGIHTDFHPDEEIVKSKTSDELVQSLNEAMNQKTGKVTATISRLKSGEDNMVLKASSSFRQRRLSLSQKTAHDPEPPTPDKMLPKRTTIFSSTEIGVKQEKKAPFGAEVLGTFSCHGKTLGRFPYDGESQSSKVC